MNTKTFVRLVPSLGALFAISFGCAVRPTGINSPNVTVNINGVNISSKIGANEAKESVQKTLVASKVALLKVDSTMGSIELRSSPEGADEIHVVATKSIHGSDSVQKLNELLPGIGVNATLDGSNLVLSASIPADYSKRNLSVAVNYVVTVPERVGFDLRTTSGNIVLTGIRGGGVAHTEYGNIEVSRAAKGLELSTSSGAISITDSPETTNVNAKSDYGNIDLAGVGGRIDADTNSGAVTVRGSKKATALTIHSDFGAVTIADSSGSIDASSDSGAVSVTNCTVLDSLNLHSEYGGVDARSITAAGSALRVEMKSASGAATFEGDASQISMDSQYGSATCSLSNRIALKGGEVHTSSGSAELTLPQSASATVEASTTSGHVDVPGGLASPSHNEDGTQQTVIVGAGAAKVKISTEYGDAILKTR